jgi:hypothetical protein
MLRSGCDRAFQRLHEPDVVDPVRDAHRLLSIPSSHSSRALATIAPGQGRSRRSVYPRLPESCRPE